MSELTLTPQVEQLMYATVDPTVEFSPGQPMPAMTTLPFRVCDNDQTKFEEACRLVELFISEALKDKPHV